MADQVIEEILARRECEPSQLIEVLQDVQEACGYIPEDAMCVVSDRLAVPLIDVYGVASFYKAFSLQPRGRHIITVCLGTACHVRGAPRMVDLLEGLLEVSPGETTADGLFTVECVNCLGACALGPIAVVDGTYHHHMTPGKLQKLIHSVRGAEEGVA
jgi:NADH:ubiquinone oxidoreductase subunit E